MSSKIDRSDLIAAIHDLAGDVDGTPTKTDMNDNGAYSTTPYYSEFDGWNAALREAGYDPNHGEVDDDDLLDDLRSVAMELDRAPTFEDMKTRGEYSPTTLARRFGTFLEAREEAGLSGRQEMYGKRADKADLLDDLRRLGEEIGRAPTQAEVDDRGQYAAQTYHRHFGSFLKSLDAAGFDTDDPDREWPADYPGDWIQRRERVRARDGYCCVDCDMSQTEHQNHYGQDLHVHHVASAGDPDDEGNLVTLCANCHPKWDRVAADPRE